MKNSYIIALIAALCILAPLSSHANAINNQQARTEHMRACMSSGGKKDICTCSFDNATQLMSATDIMDLNRSLTNKIPGNEKHLKILDKVTRKCAKEFADGTYVPATSASSVTPTLPLAPDDSELKLPTLPSPPSFADLDGLTIPAPPPLQKSAPNFDKENAKESYFTDIEIDANEDASKLAQKSIPISTSDIPLNLDIKNLRDDYKGQHDAAFFEAAARGDLKGLEAINQYLRTVDITDRSGNTPLFIAVQNGQFAAARFLLTHNASANFQNKIGQTPLHIAVFQRRPDIVQLLINNKANVNAVYGEGFTPLILTIINNDEMLLQNLLIGGANPRTAMRDGNTPVHIAATTDKPRMIEILKNYGSDLNIENNLGYTPLMVAASQNKIASASALLALGANPNHIDIYGRNAAQIAYALGYQQIVNLVLTMQQR